MSGWQPIETYREVSDKTKPILVYIPGWGVEKVQPEFACYHSFVFGGYRIPEQPDSLPSRGAGPSSVPTHWMPLPTPPADGGDK